MSTGHLQTDGEPLPEHHQPPPNAPEPLRALLERHLPGVAGRVRRMLPARLRAHESAADLLQSVCGDLLGAAVPFEYRGEAQFEHWLLTVVVNKIRARLRSLGREKRGAGQLAVVTDSELEAAHRDHHTPSHQAVLREDYERFELALARLPAHYQDVIVRVRLRGQTREQAARELGRSLASVRNLLNRAKVALSAQLDRLERGEA